MRQNSDYVKRRLRSAASSAPYYWLCRGRFHAHPVAITKPSAHGFDARSVSSLPRFFAQSILMCIPTKGAIVSFRRAQRPLASMVLRTHIAGVEPEAPSRTSYSVAGQRSSAKCLIWRTRPGGCRLPSAQITRSFDCRRSRPFCVHAIRATNCVQNGHQFTGCRVWRYIIHGTPLPSPTMRFAFINRGVSKITTGQIDHDTQKLFAKYGQRPV